MKERKHFDCRRVSLTILSALLLFTANIFAQNKLEVNGVVVDTSSGETLIGVSVQAKGTSIGTITDIDGTYSLSIEKGSILTFNYIGYEPIEKKVESTTLDVKMQEAINQLSDVVVVGYGVQKKSVVTAAISQVKGDDLDKVMSTRVDNVLKGMVSGVNITQGSGQPGEGSKVRIRGIGTINNSDPLYIVDGMAIGGGIDYLNPADIASVEVLKDAASAAIYGARAANGVILVTTKKGVKGKAAVSYKFSYGWQNPWRKRSVLNAEQYGVLINEMLMNDGSKPLYGDPKSYGKGTDWQDELFNYDAPVVEHQLSVSGASDKASYFLSFGYFDQEGIVGGDFDRSNYRRYSLRLNGDYNIFDEAANRKFFTKLKVGTNVAYSRVESTGISTNSEFGSPLGSALAISPMLNVYSQDPKNDLLEHPTAVTDRNGYVYTIVGPQYNEITNPLAQLALPGDRGNSDKVVANFWAELELFKNLKLKTSYGADLAFWGNDGHRIPYYLGETNQSDMSAVWSSMNRGYTWLNENTLSYTNNIAGHDFTVLLGQSAQSYQARNLSGTSYKLRDPNRPHIDGTEEAENRRKATGQLAPRHRLASYFARLSYNYQERYMAEVTVRRDGSSNFGPNNLWATFPSVSVGWNVTNEKFMEKRPDFISNLKVRGSWGKNGNQAIDAFRYRSLMQGGNNYILGLEGSMILAPGAKPNGYPNQNIKWEESEQFDVGFDAYLFNSALTFTFDWYKKKTNGMLMTMPLPEYIGDTRPVGNVGNMENSGVEFDATYRFNVAGVNLRVGANATYLKNKLVKLGNDTGWANYDAVHGTGTITRGQNGQPFPYFYGHRTNGIFQYQSEIDSYVNDKGELLQPKAKPGDVRFVDANVDGIIDDEDRVKLGKGMPDWTFGFNIGADWKGIDLSMQFNASVGNDIYDASRRNDLPYINMPEYMLNRWVGPGSSNSIPRLTMKNENNNWRSSDLYIKNGSFLRLRNIQLGYTLPKSLTSKAYISNLRVYINAENLLTFTSYKGFDPEISSGGTSLGVDRGVYPQPRTISIGANVSF